MQTPSVAGAVAAKSAKSAAPTGLFTAESSAIRRAMLAPVPAEWSPHRALWLGFPSHADLWEDNLAPAQAEAAALAKALTGPGEERVRLLVCGDNADAAARKLLE